MKNTKIKYGRRVFLAGANVYRFLHVFVLMALLTNCSDFVAVDLPKNQLTSAAVFESRETAEAALRSIYGRMREFGLSSGGFNGLGYLMGL